MVAGMTLLAAGQGWANDQDLRSQIEARMPDLNAFVRLVTDYKSTEFPKVVIKTPEELNKIFYREHYDGQDKRCDIGCVKALAYDGAIFMGTDFMPGRDDFILVHELVHFQQFAAGKGDQCPGSLEPEAYAVQDKFVTATGRGMKSDPMTVMLLAASCSGF